MLPKINNVVAISMWIKEDNNYEYTTIYDFRTNGVNNDVQNSPTRALYLYSGQRMTNSVFSTEQ